jgi:hypothetical protein
VVSTRRAWAAHLVGGRAASEAPDILAAAFALCGDAHRHAARWALAAARGRAHAHYRKPDQS